MTCYGSVYEKEAIEQWLKSNSTDPATGQEVMNKELKPVDPLTEENIEYMRMLYTVEMDASAIEIVLKKERYDQLKQQTVTIQGLDKEVWAKYCKTKRVQILDKDQEVSNYFFFVYT